MPSDPEILVELGRRLRAARLAARRSQRDVGRQAGLSQAVISKIELGRGGGVDLATWLAVTRAVGLRLDIGPTSDALVARCHRLIAEVAERGGWTAAMSTDESVLTRDNDRVVVRAWDLVTSVGHEIGRFEDSLGQRRGTGGRVSGIVVIPATGANRRRVSELRNELSGTFPARANAWFAALVNAKRPMPGEPGILWAFPDGLRLRPATGRPGWIWTAVGDAPRFATDRRSRR